MTGRIQTVTDHILEAQSILDREDALGKTVVLLAPGDIQRALDCLEHALDAINLARCEAQTALDKF